MTRYVGAALSRRETRKLVLGRGSYVGDLTAPGMFHAAFVRSPHAHARIVGIDVQGARRAPGIAAVLTGHELASVICPLRIAPPIPGLLPMEMTTLPTEKVRFAGDPVACVVGADRYQVEDACALVDVSYTPLPAVVDPEHAQDPDLPRVDETIPANRPYEGTFAHGDVDATLRAAYRIVEARFHQGRQTHAPMEPRGCLANWLPGDETLTFWHSTLPRGADHRGGFETPGSPRTLDRDAAGEPPRLAPTEPVQDRDVLRRGRQVAIEIEDAGLSFSHSAPR